MRGRLLPFGKPFSADIAQLDTAATEAAGEYDPLWRTPVLKVVDGQRVVARQERIVRLKCQVEAGQHMAQTQTPNGDVPRTSLDLVFHFEELEKNGLIDPATQGPLLRVNDRLVAIYNGECQLVQTYPGLPGGVYATHVQPRGWGLGGQRNLVVVSFQDRPQGLR